VFNHIPQCSNKQANPSPQHSIYNKYNQTVNNAQTNKQISNPFRDANRKKMISSSTQISNYLLRYQSQPFAKLKHIDHQFIIEESWLEIQGAKEIISSDFILNYTH
jgi:hypothetical protein